jgi:hypothetical protein
MKGEWISVKDRLPDYKWEMKVLVLLTEEFIKTQRWVSYYEDRLEKAWWKGQCECFSYEDIEDANHIITHWMPLPSPPEEKDC